MEAESDVVTFAEAAAAAAAAAAGGVAAAGTYGGLSRLVVKKVELRVVKSAGVV